MSRAPPVALTSYPGMAEIREAEGPKTFWDADFVWDDPVRGWEAFALLGALLVLDAVVLLWAVTRPALVGASSLGIAPVGYTYAAGTGLLFLGTLPTAYLGYTEMSLAFLGSAGTGVVVGLAGHLSVLPPGYPLISAPGPYWPDLLAFLVLALVGVAVLGVGAFRFVRAVRADADEY
jgi:hypothetical protein